MHRFEELQLWGNSFGQQLLVATLRRSFREPLCRMALGSRFGEQVCRIAALGQQLWRTALGTTLGSSAGEQLWVAALGSNFGQLSRPAGSFGQQHWSFGELLWDVLVATLKSSFGEQLCGFAAALTESCLEERQLWGVALENNFGKPLSETTFGGRLSNFGAAFGSRFAEWLWGDVLVNRLAESQLWGNSFGEQLWA